ncbi:MAG: GyrI-like domain-containing protein [Pseudomonadota bacterium]
MSKGLVYLRPMKVTHVRVHGAGCDAANAAWTDLSTHLHDSLSINRIDRSFGMIFGSAFLGGTASPEPFYDAAIEWLPEMALSPDSPLRLRTLPGGTYLRHRMEGERDQVRDTFRELCLRAEHETGLPVDPKRPLIEIYIGSQPGKLSGARLDLCVPVDPARSKSRDEDHPAAA